MGQLLQPLREHLLVSAAIWFVAFLGVSALFAGGRVRALARGLWDVFISVAVSPFVFMKKAVTTMLRDKRELDAEIRSSDQYLLNRLLIFLQAMLIVAAIGGIAAGVVATWNAWLPAEETRDAVRRTRERVKEQREVTKRLSDEVAKLDDEWRSREAAAVAEFKTTRQRTISTATQNLTDSEAVMNASTNTNAITFLQRIQEVSRQRASVDDIVREMRGDLQSYAYYLDGPCNDAMARWVEAWRAKADAERDLADFSVERVRSDAQPGYAERKQLRAEQDEALKQLEAELAALKEAGSFRWLGALGTAGSAAFMVLLLVWMSGVVIELAWLAIRVADDVHHLRTKGIRAFGAQAENAPFVRAQSPEVITDPMLLS